MSESFPPSSPPTLAGDIDAEMKDDEAGRVPSSQFARPTEPRPFSPLMRSVSSEMAEVKVEGEAVGGVQESKEKSKEELAKEVKERKIVSFFFPLLFFSLSWFCGLFFEIQVWQKRFFWGCVFGLLLVLMRGF